MLFYNRLNHVYYTVKMKIFITGVAGFLGCHLAKKLTELGHKVSGVDNMIGGEISNIPKNITFTKGNCENNELMNKLTKGVDIVYHCAATAHEGLSVFSPNFIAKNKWAEIRAPFKDFKKSNFYQPKKLSNQNIKSIGLVAAFDNFYADICLSEIGFF